MHTTKLWIVAIDGAGHGSTGDLFFLRTHCHLPYLRRRYGVTRVVVIEIEVDSEGSCAGVVQLKTSSHFVGANNL